MVNTPVGVSWPFVPVETVEAATGTPLRNSTMRCVARLTTISAGPSPPSSGAQTYCPVDNVGTISRIDRSPLVTAWAWAEAATSAAAAQVARYLRETFIDGPSHVRIIGSAAAFGRDPVDILGRILDVAGLAVDAVLRVDHELGIALFDPDVFVDRRGAVAGLGTRIDRPVHLLRDRRVLEAQVAGLVLDMVRAREKHRRKPVEADHAVRLGISDWSVKIGPPGAPGVGMVAQRERKADAQGPQPHVRPCEQRAERIAETRDERLSVADK